MLLQLTTVATNRPEIKSPRCKISLLMPDLWILVILPCATISDCHIDPAATQVTNVDSVCTAESSKSEGSASILLFNKSLNTFIYLQNRRVIISRSNLNKAPRQHLDISSSGTSCLWEAGMPMFAGSWKLPIVINAMPHVLHLHMYFAFLQQLPGLCQALLDGCCQCDFNFPSKLLDTQEYRGWGLFQQARFAVMGDGSLYPSEKSSRWNLKPSLYCAARNLKGWRTLFYTALLSICDGSLMHMYRYLLFVQGLH